MNKPSKQPRVLLVAYACEPNSGSEPGTGWNTATMLAAECQVTVVTRANNQQAIEQELSKHEKPNLSFIYIDPPRFLISLKKAGLLPTQVFYFFWQVCVALELWDASQAGVYDVIHQLTFNSFEVPPLIFLKKSKAKLVWGPVGGGQVVPLKHLPLFGLKGAVMEFLRSTRVRLSAFNPLCIAAFKNASLVYFANYETRDRLSKWHHGYSELMIDVGVDMNLFDGGAVSRQANKTPVILFGGRLTGRKGTMLLVRALLDLRSRCGKFECRIFGEGPDGIKMQRYIRKYDMDDCVLLLGNISHQKMAEEFAHADIFIFPSLRDTSGAIVLEAMATSVTSVCLDHQGAGVMISSDCGIKIKPSSIEDMALKISEALDKLIKEPEICRAMGKAARKRVESEYEWRVRNAKILDGYRRILG